MLHIINTNNRRAVLAAGLTVCTLGALGQLGVGAADAAPTPSPHASARALDLSNQTPTVGVTRSGVVPTGGFVAPLGAIAIGSDSTIVWLEPMPKDACSTSLKDAEVAVTWKNTTTAQIDDATFAACSAGKPAHSPVLKTGVGTVALTVSVLGGGGTTLTLSPGTATLHR